jgi:hypothetical protein
MEANKINLNGFEYTFTENSEWIYKAIPFSPSKPKTGPEKPQIHLVEDIEASYKHAFEKMLAVAMKDIAKYLDV